MKLVDKMKDESLGSAILYNFTKGYGNVSMDVYDIVLPLIFNDDFRNRLSKDLDVEQTIKDCLANNSNFVVDILEQYELLKEVTNKSLGLCMIRQYLSFEFEDGTMKGVARDSQILEFNEVIALGKFFAGKSLEEIMDYLKKNDCRIVVLDSGSLGEGIDLMQLSRFGTVEIYQASSKEEVVERIKNATITLTNKCRLTKEILSQAKKLELVCISATGTNNVDLDYCHENNIKVCNVSGYSSKSVAQHTLALLLDLCNKNHEYHEYVSSGEYCKSPIFTHFGSTFNELDGKTWTIVGLGAIGREVAKIADVFGCHVQYYSASDRSYDVEYKKVSFDEMLESSDIITVHAPLNDQTYNLINKDAFSKMKPNCMLVNVGRGGIVNEVDLVDALNANQLQGAALDVFEVEPLPQDSPLLTIKDPNKLLLTPHIAWATVEARTRLFNQVLNNIESYFKGDLQNAV